MTGDVTPRLKPDPVDCPCGCGRQGQPRATAWKDGLGPHVRRCDCRRCQGGRQRSKSRRREHRVAKAVGGSREPLSGGLSGADVTSTNVDIEETANGRLVAGLRRWWDSKQVRSKTARLYARTHSDAVPVFVASWDGRPQVAVMRFDDFAELARRANDG